MLTDIGKDFFCVRFMFSCFLQADGTENLFAELCLHMIAVIDNLSLREIFFNKAVIGCIHVHSYRYDC